MMLSLGWIVAGVPGAPSTEKTGSLPPTIATLFTLSGASPVFWMVTLRVCAVPRGTVPKFRSPVIVVCGRAPKRLTQPCGEPLLHSALHLVGVAVEDDVRSVRLERAVVEVALVAVLAGVAGDVVVPTVPERIRVGLELLVRGHVERDVDPGIVRRPVA